MVDNQPTPGNWTCDLMDQFDTEVNICPVLTEPIPSRPSEVLGPDGEPVSVDLPRRVIGFDLRARGS